MTWKAKQVVINTYGSPDVMELINTELPFPGPGELLIRTEAIGVNYSDTLRRRNLYFQSTPLPFVLGGEAVGEIIATGPGVESPFTLGTRVLAILPYGGGYSSLVTAIAQYCIPLPPQISPETATVLFVQGSTAQLLISTCAGRLEGKTVLVNAASGGVGSLIVQLAKRSGARVAAACSSEEKLSKAKQLGADIIVNYTDEGWAEELRMHTGNDGIDMVFEAVGGEIYNESLRLLKPGGKMVIYGCASGIQGDVHPEYFVDRNISLIGFNLSHFITSRTAEWMEAMQQFTALVVNGGISINTEHSYALEDAALAHRMIEERMTTGKVVLTV